MIQNVIMMNKYIVEIGEICLERISEYYIVYTKDSKEELEDNEKFISAVDEAIVELYDNYGEEDEDWEDFQDDMGIIKIDDWKDEYKKYDLPILLDER